MDARRFDDLARRLAVGATRRGLLKTALAGLAAGTLGRGARRVAAAGQPNGTSCTRSTDCASYRCVDGVCCNAACTGQCEACNLPGTTGTCSPVTGAPVGNRAACPGTGPCKGTCNGTNRTSCAFPGSSVNCGASTCSGGVQTAYTCAGNGTCAATTTSCGLYACNAAGTACLTTCAGSAECAGAAFCANGVCQGDRPLGQACSANDQCQSGLCVDGFCCDRACAGQCESCNQPGYVGFCTPTPGVPCNDGNLCTLNDVCQNNGSCKGTPKDCSAQNDQCNTGVCRTSDGVCVKQPRANGTGCNADDNACTVGDTCQNGACVAGPVKDCSAQNDQCNTGICRQADGACIKQPRTNGTSCTDGNACTQNDTCQNGSCVPGPPLACNVCTACVGGTCQPVATDARCGTGCCNGVCCPAGKECVGNTCQATCFALQAACDPSRGFGGGCCQGQLTFCEDVRTCGGEGVPQCCVGGGSRCEASCDCCDPDVCVGGVCCGNLMNLPCDDEQQPCCAGFQCLNGTCQLADCLRTQDFCDPDNNACCQDEPTDCEFQSGCGVILTRCCHPYGGTCAEDCDCCGGGICQGGRCCLAEDERCTDSDDCCAGMTCRGGTCQFPCPLGAFPCGSTCCANRQHCVNGTCQCVELQGACDSENNLCCQDEETICPEFNPFGNSDTCCRPQGGHCGTAADCCREVYDTQWGRDTCGDDGRCGGAGAYCGFDEDCVDGRRCIGACFGPGIGFHLCSFSGGYPECPAGSLCSQRRCVYPNELPD